MKPLNTYNVCLLGRTGNGKSSLINAMFGTKFPTDTLSSCTKELYTVTIMTDQIPDKDAVTVIDTPGIGEFSSNSPYQRYYDHAVSISDCIVAVTTLDRTDAPMQRLLNQLKPLVDPNKNVKFIIAINHIDSRIVANTLNDYVPWNDNSNCPSEACIQNVEKRIEIIHQRFDGRFLPFEVIPVCAKRNYGIEKLKNSIMMNN